MTFSIIVPCYNLEPWIKQCLDSVLSQDYQDWECIVVDDESTDGSGAILDEYASRDSRFKVIHQKNAGEGGARNAGLKIAKGEWVFFLDGDDLMMPNSLDQLAKLASENVDLIRIDLKNFKDGEKPVYTPSNPSFKDVDISDEINMSDFFTYVWQHLYRRDRIIGIEFKRYIRGCDRVFIDDVLLNRVDKVRVSDLCCYGYRQRAGSAMSSMPSLQVLCDEMDHRLDIMEYIDVSHKKVKYAGNRWLEEYFTRQFYHIIQSRGADKAEVISSWLKRLSRLSRVKGLSTYGRFVASSCNLIHNRYWNALVCYVVPRIREGGSPLRALKRKLINAR